MISRLANCEFEKAVSMDKTMAQLKAISDKNRLRVLSVLLVHDELCACQITEFLQVAGATASRHLARMVQAEILVSRKQGRWVYFRVNREDASLGLLIKWVAETVGNSPQQAQDLDDLEKILRIPCEDLSRRQRESGNCAAG